MRVVPPGAPLNDGERDVVARCRTVSVSSYPSYHPPLDPPPSTRVHVPRPSWLTFLLPQPLFPLGETMALSFKIAIQPVSLLESYYCIGVSVTCNSIVAAVETGYRLRVSVSYARPPAGRQGAPASLAASSMQFD